MSGLPAAVISDANVLIDYISVDRMLVLRLVSEHLFSIKLPRSILNEVDQLTENQAEALGLKVIDATLAQLQEASKRGGSLSQPDKLCFAMAHDNHWAVWTSDKPLHTKCTEEGISVFWGLQLMLDLVRGGWLDADYALETARRIEEVNERITKAILTEFERLLESN